MGAKNGEKAHTTTTQPVQHPHMAPRRSRLLLLLFAALGVALPLLAHAGGETHRAVCDLQTLCNGIACTQVCKRGTVQTDPWTDYALQTQRTLQLPQVFIKAQFPGTHNSAITQADGFGIEQDFMEDLLGESLYNGDDVGEGVCQYLSVTDQLRMGIRHIEVDVNVDHTLDEIVTCHSPVPDLLVTEKAVRAAEARNITLGWEVEKFSCLKTFVRFEETLQEIKAWMDANPSEFVIIYIDTKFDPEPKRATQGYQVKKEGKRDRGATESKHSHLLFFFLPSHTIFVVTPSSSL